MKKLGTKTIYRNPFVEVQLHDVRFPNGKVIKRYLVLSAHDGAMVVPITTKGEIVYLEHYRYAVNKNVVTLPGGLTDTKREHLLTTAKRELLEETGYTSDSFEFLGYVYPLPGNNTQKTAVYIAKGCRKKDRPNLDETERGIVKKATIEAFLKLIVKNKVRDCITLATVMLALPHLKEMSHG